MEALTTEEVIAALDEFGRIARERMRACSPCLVGAMGGAAIDFLTTEERAEQHQLWLALPTFAEERAAAKARIAARIASRKTRRTQA